MHKGVVKMTKYDDHYNKMLAVYEACELAGVDIPDDVERYFDYDKPNNGEDDCKRYHYWVGQCDKAGINK